MTVLCTTCLRYYDDAERWARCPHGPLWAAHDAYCRAHDLVDCPCRIPRKDPIEADPREGEKGSVCQR